MKAKIRYCFDFITVGRFRWYLGLVFILFAVCPVAVEAVEYDGSIVWTYLLPKGGQYYPQSVKYWYNSGYLDGYGILRTLTWWAYNVVKKEMFKSIRVPIVGITCVVLVASYIRGKPLDYGRQKSELEMLGRYQ